MEVARLFIISPPTGKGLPWIHVQIMMWIKETEKKEAWQEVEEITSAMSLNSLYLSFPTKMAPHFELTPRDFLPYRFFSS